MAGNGEDPRPVNPFNMDLRGRLAQFFFLITLFSFPIFSVPCHKGTCTSSVEVLISYLHHANVVNKAVLKSVAYPSAFMTKVESIVGDNEDFTLPDWNTLLTKYEGDGADAAAEPASIHPILLAGSVLSLVGAILSMFGPSYVSLAGMVALLWYVTSEGTYRQDVFLQPLFTLAMVCALGCLPIDRLFRWMKKSLRAGSSQSKFASPYQPTKT